MTTQEKVKVFVEYGFSQTKIAEMAGINKSTLGKWVRGDRLTISEDSRQSIEAALMEITDNISNAVYGEAADPIEYDEIELD